MKVLVVEDEIILQELYKVILAKSGHEVCDACETEQDAIHLASSHNYDLIILDIYLLNDGNGINAAELIREFSSVPILFISANQDVSLKERAGKVKNSEYLTKPVSPLILRAVIKKYSDRLIN